MAKNKAYGQAKDFLKHCLCDEEQTEGFMLALAIEEAAIERDKEYLTKLLDEIINRATQIKNAL